MLTMTDWVRAQKDNSNSTQSCKAATVISWHNAKHNFFFLLFFFPLRHTLNSFLTQAELFTSQIMLVSEI